ncbi:MAG: hydrogen gas-evolving membrane-bound hydrogenase subunit E [Rhodocyclaceae bacterium]
MRDEAFETGEQGVAVLSAVFAIAIAALLAPTLGRRFDDRAGWMLAVVPFAAFIWFVTQIPVVAGGDAVTASLAWVPALDVSVAMRLDGLSLLFALLITGIGTLIVLYAGAYLSDHHHLGRFYAYLLLFMMAMLGLVLADDLVAMFVFWELTSVASFLLISFQHEKAVSRRAALQALLITGGGGLALLAGLVLLGVASDAWRFSALDAAAVEASPLYLGIMVLVLIGCFTKSAQVPFHLWLPNAMNAPTPVSAYLHSATMVKAGVYLMARLNPTLGGEAGWGLVLVGFGAVTALVGAVLAIRQTDLKRLLAYTTVTVLGQLTMLIGTNTTYGLQAFVLYLLAHSLYKGALFMAVGAVDHATGTRELSRLGGLIKIMPLTGAAVALAAFSNAGLPPFFGFIAKEFAYAGLIQMGLTGWVVTIAMIVTNALLLAAAGLVFIRTFLGAQGNYPRHPHEVSVPMWLGPMLLAIAGFLLGAWHHWPETWLVNAAVQSVARGDVDVRLYLWGGVTPALITSLITVALGVVFYRFRHQVRLHIARWRVFWGVSGDLIWDRFLKRVFELAALTASGFQHGSLRLHLTLLSGVLTAVVFVAVAAGGEPVLSGGHYSALNVPAVLGSILALAGAGAAAAMRGRLALVAALGASGLGLALFFLAANAPDVAITQLMVETLTVVFLAFVLRSMPAIPRVADKGALSRVSHLLISLFFGVAVALSLLVAVNLPLAGDIAGWYVNNSYPGGKGGNVVNVILVDFRAFDTLGEIVVVALAALAAATLLGGGQLTEMTRKGEPEFGSVLLRHAIRPLAGLMVLVSLVLLWRGHNLPGGGFIGGLVAAVGFILVVLTFGNYQARALMGVRPTLIVGVGLACAVGAGLIGLLAGEAFLKGLWMFPLGLPLGTPLLFDVGVFLTVFGSVMHMMQRLAGRPA